MSISARDELYKLSVEALLYLILANLAITITV